MSALKSAAPTQKKTRSLGAREPSTLSARALPPLMTIAAALRKTTEFLACELVAPTAHPPEWTDFEWRIGRAAAAMHGVSSLLCAGLRWAGPESWRQFLGEQRGRLRRAAPANRAPVGRYRSRGAPQRDSARGAERGGALRAQYLCCRRAPAAGDFDLLVRRDAVQATARLLESCGYTLEYTHRRDQAFRPAGGTIPPADRLGEHVDNPITVEVHTRIAEPLPVLGTDITPLIFPGLRMPALTNIPRPPR